MPPIRPTVLLRHTLPDGSFHFDWMLARDDDGPLRTFRLETDISAGCEQFVGTSLPDHRRRYLDYEGPISGNRGRVQRVASGSCVLLVERAELLCVDVDLGLCRGVLRGIRQAEAQFLFGFEQKRVQNRRDFG